MPQNILYAAHQALLRLCTELWCAFNAWERRFKAFLSNSRSRIWLINLLSRLLLIFISLRKPLLTFVSSFASVPSSSNDDQFDKAAKSLWMKRETQRLARMRSLNQGGIILLRIKLHFRASDSGLEIWLVTESWKLKKRNAHARSWRTRI